MPDDSRRGDDGSCDPPRVEDVDALCERARDAGATITEDPADQNYGERRFGAIDPEGHKWYFSQKIAAVEPADRSATEAS